MPSQGPEPRARAESAASLSSGSCVKSTAAFLFPLSDSLNNIH